MGSLNERNRCGWRGRPRPGIGLERQAELRRDRDRRRASDDGAATVAQEQLFYSFNLETHVPGNHLLRGIDCHLDLSDLH